MTNCTQTPGETQILSIALEDYFHGPAFRKRIGRKRWSRFETRFEANCLRLLDLLQAQGAQATFFVNTWVAGQRAELVQEVLARGHEIALAAPRGHSFRLVSPAVLREQVRTQRLQLEEACGRQVLGFRSSDIHLQARHLWALQVLAEEGFAYDSSLSPFGFHFARQPWRQFIHRESFGGGQTIWEVPLSSYRLGPVMLPMAGGNYFRQAPELLVRGLVRRWAEDFAQPMVLYLRLWDFDPEQPRMETGSVMGNLRHYRNGQRMVRTIEYLLANYRFGSIAGHLGLQQQEVTAATEKNLRETGTGPGQRLTPTAACPARAADDRAAVSVIVPCYNEEASIPYLARALGELQEALAPRYQAEFILVDDGSRDQTWATLERCFAGRTDVLLLRQMPNAGVSAAIRAGLQVAREMACSMDCDCSYDPFELLPMLDLLRTQVDLVTASPYHPQGSVLNVPGWRLLLSRGASALYRLVTGLRLHTFTSCLRVYRRSVVLALPMRHPGFLGVAEMAGRLALQGGCIVEYPTTLESRIFGRSKMKVARTVLGHLGLLSRLAWARLVQQGLPGPFRRLRSTLSRGPVKDAKSAQPGIEQDPSKIVSEVTL